jgi:hypothetical protein
MLAQYWFIIFSALDCSLFPSREVPGYHAVNPFRNKTPSVSANISFHAFETMNPKLYRRMICLWLASEWSWRQICTQVSRQTIIFGHGEKLEEKRIALTETHTILWIDGVETIEIESRTMKPCQSRDKWNEELRFTVELLKSNNWRWTSACKCKGVPIISELCQLMERNRRNIPIPWAVGMKWEFIHFPAEKWLDFKRIFRISPINHILQNNLSFSRISSVSVLPDGPIRSICI